MGRIDLESQVYVHIEQLFTKIYIRILTLDLQTSLILSLEKKWK